jgi:amino acid adenylation domain-containing protein
MVESGGAGLVVSDDPTPLEAATLVTDEALVVGADHQPEGPAPQAADLAYVIYTSGSTGRPKGVEVPHGALRNFLGSMRDEPGLSPDDVLLAVTTLSFDIAGLELFLPLCVGARVVIVSGETATNGGALAERLEASKATVMQATPATWRMVLDAGWAGRLRQALCGGEALPPELAPVLRDRADALWNLYGPTETTIWSALARVADGPITVGRPIANTRIYVLDPRGQVVPDGVSGELWIAGAGVARGYRNQPALTEERFRADPLVPDERMYRTGDLGRWRGDGLLEHLGRLDSQVKVHGFRIELGEIEAALEGLDEIRQAVVAARGEAQDRRLVAYIVFEQGRDLLAGEIRRALGTTLPAYMVPGLVVPLDGFSLTPNGKVDRNALRDPLEAVASVERGHEPPEGPVEGAIAAVWLELLGVGQVGRHDNFFELGGHSLLAMRAVAEVDRRSAVRIHPRDMFFRSLSQLALVATSPAGGELGSDS